MRVSASDELTKLCVRDLLTAFKLGNQAQFLAKWPASRFASMVRAFDDRVGTEGLQAAGEFILSHFAGSVAVVGANLVPRTGPTIVASNHPGMTDAMALWTAMKRDDLKIIAGERDLLQQLPNIRQHLILIQPGGSTAFRAALSHLKAGGCLLTFPAGHIEPDLAVRSGALESLTSWSNSIVLLGQRVPKTVIIPAFVKGVISPAATRCSLLRYMSDQKDRDWAAATLQILLPAFRRVNVSVQFGAPVKHELVAVQQRMRELICGEGVGWSLGTDSNDRPKPELISSG